MSDATSRPSVTVYRCSECSLLYAFTDEQVKDFPGGLYCSVVRATTKPCYGLLERLAERLR